MTTLNKLLKQHKQIILAIPSDGEMSWMNDDSDSDWTNHYLATITVQYVLGDSYITFDSECLVSIGEHGKLTFEQYDTSPDAHQTHYKGVEDMYKYDEDELMDLHNDHIVYDEPEFMMIEWW